MGKFLNKKVAIKINLPVFALIAILLVAILLAVQFHVPENLFFRLLCPEWVESAQVQVAYQEYDQLNRQEIEELVSVLNDIRIKDDGVRSLTPHSQESADFHIHLKWGQTLHINTGIGLAINACEYTDYGNVRPILWELKDVMQQIRGIE